MDSDADKVFFVKNDMASMRDWHIQMVEQHAKAAEWHASMSEKFEEVNHTDSTQVEKRIDLVNILNDHSEEFGSFGKSIEEIVGFILD